MFCRFRPSLRLAGRNDETSGRVSEITAFAFSDAGHLQIQCDSTVDSSWLARLRALTIAGTTRAHSALANFGSPAGGRVGRCPNALVSAVISGLRPFNLIVLVILSAQERGVSMPGFKRKRFCGALSAALLLSAIKAVAAVDLNDASYFASRSIRRLAFNTVQKRWTGNVFKVTENSFFASISTYGGRRELMGQGRSIRDISSYPSPHQVKV